MPCLKKTSKQRKFLKLATKILEIRISNQNTKIKNKTKARIELEIEPFD